MKRSFILVASAVFVILPLVRPVSVANSQQDPPRGDCCFHIYSVGSNLGWASSLLNYTYVRTRPDPADETIFQNLLRAGEHVEAASRTCSRMNPAWYDWSNKKQFLTNQVNAIRQRPDSVIRQQVAGSIATTYQWGQALRVRIFDEHAYEHDTCAEKYFRLGFLLGYAQQTFGIAEERMQYGRNDWAAPVNDARSYLSQSLRVLTEYFGVAGCTEIRDLNLEGRITNLLNADLRSLSAMTGEMRAIWGSLQARVTQRCDLGTGPGPGGGGAGNLAGQWVLSFGGAGGAVGTANENAITNRGELMITATNGGLAGRLRVGPLPWEDLVDITYSNGVLRFTRPPTYYHQSYEAAVRGNRLEGTFRNWSQREAYKWWGEKRD